MLKRFFSILILTVICLSLSAAYIVNHPVTLQQADGSVIHCFASGDEFYNWYHDANNFTIISNGHGYYCYAVLSSDKVIASQYVVGTVDPASVGLKPGVSISAKDKQAIRDSFYKNTPERPVLKGHQDNKGNIGMMNNLVVYITFSDQTPFTEDTTYYYDLFNYTTDNSKQSLRNYFHLVSYNKLDINSHFYPLTNSNVIVSYVDSHPRQYYMPYDPVSAPLGYNTGNDERTQREHKLLHDAVTYIADMVPDDLDLDYNNDGLVDNVVFIIKGETTAWSTLLWPHRWSLYTNYAYINGKQVWDFNFQLETFLNSEQASVLCHEMNHSLGAPDLYRYSDNTIDPVGSWDVMGSNTTPAQSMSAYMKYRYGGWLDNLPEITKGGVYTLNTPWQQTNNMYKIASPNSNGEYFIVEYRNRKQYFDTKIPGDGLLVYRINPSESGNAGGPPDEIYIFREDGFDTKTNGNINNAYFSATSGRTSFDDNTNPPCFLKDNDPGGIYIKNVGEAGSQISFEVWFNKTPVAQFSASDTIVTTNCPVDFKCDSYIILDSWSWTFQDATPSTSNEENPKGIVFNSPGYKTVSLTVHNSHGGNTKVKEGYIYVNGTDAPSANFYANVQSVCYGSEVQLYDSSSLCPTSWQWSFVPNTISYAEGSSASSQNPVIIVGNDQNYSVTLTVSNVNGSATVTKNNFLTTDGLNANGYLEDFENINSLTDAGWTVVNPDNKLTWDLVKTIENDAINHAAYVNFFSYPFVNRTDYLISPSFNLDDSYKLTFRHAFELNRNNTSDTLAVSVSTDCGTTWERVATFYEDGSNSFVTGPKQSVNFIPTSANDWCGHNYSDCKTVDLSAFKGNRNVLIRFESVKITGNNLFIDDISLIKKIDGIEDNVVNAVKIYPNPGTGLYTVVLPDASSNYVISVYDILGKQIFKTLSTDINVYINISSYQSGLYFVNVKSDTYNENIKIIKQ